MFLEVKDYWIKPANGPAQTYGVSSNAPQPVLQNEHIGGGSIDDHPVVYPPMPGQVAMNTPDYNQNQGPYVQMGPNPVVGDPCQPGAVGCTVPMTTSPAPMMAPQPPLQACQPGVPCTGTAYPAGNQVVLDDQPPMNDCQPYSPSLYYTNCGQPEREGFFAGVRVGVMVWPDADDFKIVHSKNGIITTYQEDYSVVPRVSLLAGYRFNNYFALESALDLPQTQEWKSWFLSVSPKLMYPMAGSNVIPYIKGGPVFGALTWADAPGSFDDTLGWEIGGGVDIELGDGFTVEAGAAYRNIIFKYDEPINTATPNGDLDMSGYSLDVAFRYRF